MEDLDCQDVVEIVTDYLENVLPESERRALEAHLQECDGCEAYLAQINAIRTNLGSVQLAPLHEIARTTLITTFREWKKSA